MQKLVLRCLTVLCLLAGPGRVHAQALLSFSGGAGTPLTITLSQPVLYTITTAADRQGLVFVFKDVGQLYGLDSNPTSTITFTLNASAPFSSTTPAPTS